MDLTLTFLATFTIREGISAGIDNEVEFLTMGQYRRYSMIAFIEAMDIYEPAFPRTPAFRQLPLGLPHRFRAGNYWSQLGSGFYSSSATKGFSFRHLSDRVLHYIFARSTMCRTDSEGVVSARDVL